MKRTQAGAVPLLQYAWAGVLLAAALLAGPVRAAPVPGVDAAAAKLIAKLNENQQAGGRDVVVSPIDFYDGDSKISPPVAIDIQKEVSAALSNAGYTVIRPSSPNQAFWVIGGTWTQAGDKIQLSLQAKPWRDKAWGRGIVTPSIIEASAVPADRLKPDADAWARTLVLRLSDANPQLGPSSLYVRPLRFSGQAGDRRMYDYLQGWFQRAITDSSRFVAIDAKTQIASLDTQTVRTRAIRPVARPGLSLTGDLVDAEFELAGRVEPRDNALLVNVDLRAKGGDTLSTASVEIPADDLPLPRIRPTQQAAVQATQPAEAVPVDISNKGLQIELSTTAGEGIPNFKVGEKIRFIIRVNREAHVYLFNFDSKGGATLLYPAFGVGGGKLKAETALLLPEDGLPYELEVQQPVGEDIIWAVASEKPIDLPKELTGDLALTEKLREAVRGQMAKAESGTAEAQIVVRTSND
ncbi:DUF4384 domain-containing protein [Zavarzinia sp. CC-PAN008]|uniref:DUF4384 domain-containing protein n=1 Tax=Zavarzinia sp. CC-PAN008 TaxID=3243332 RepID=UPI003F74294A